MWGVLMDTLCLAVQCDRKPLHAPQSRFALPPPWASLTLHPARPPWRH